MIAYKISAKASTQLVTATFKAALKTRQPSDHLIFHSDRGCQYTPYAFRQLLLQHGFTQSFSRTKNPYDNSVMEAFFSSLKQEEIYRTSYRSFADCKARIQADMNLYNASRPHRANNYRTPDKTEEDYRKRENNLAV